MEHIDLHIHSSYSDGTDRPEVIVQKAIEAGLTTIALTDHNTMAGTPEFLNACREGSIRGIPGIELTTSYRGREVHLLGLFDQDPEFQIDKYPVLNQVIKDYAVCKVRQNETIIMKLVDGRIGDGKLSLEGYREYLSENHIENANRVHIARYLIECSAAKSIDDAMERLIGRTCPYYAERTVISTEEAIHCVVLSGGIAIPAHLGEYSFSKEEAMRFMQEAVLAGAAGFELQHPHNDQKTIELIREFAEEWKMRNGTELMLTAGSDYHGANKPNRLGIPYV